VFSKGIALKHYTSLCLLWRGLGTTRPWRCRTWLPHGFWTETYNCQVSKFSKA